MILFRSPFVAYFRQATLNKQLEEERQHAEQQVDNIKNEHRQLVEEYDEQKRNLETQLSESNQNFVQISESLSETIQSAKLQQEKSEQQIVSRPFLRKSKTISILFYLDCSRT